VVAVVGILAGVGFVIYKKYKKEGYKRDSKL
jgi:hypothetical protein